MATVGTRATSHERARWLSIAEPNERHELRGREKIHYVNRSPDELPYLWLFLEQNICGPTSITEKLDQPPLVFLGSTIGNLEAGDFRSRSRDEIGTLTHALGRMKTSLIQAMEMLDK